MKKLVVAFSAIAFLFVLAGCQTTTTEFNSANSIQVYTRDTTSGTREAFFKGIDFDDAVEDNTVLVSDYVEVDGNGSMITSVQNDVYGIGYISLSSLTDTGLVGLDYEGVEATQANVLNGTYGLQRPFNYITRASYSNETVGQIVEAFVAYMGTVDGKATIADHHGIVETSSSDVSWDDISSNYSVCSLDNSAVTVYFGGSTSVESIARALSSEFATKCGNFVPSHNHLGSGDAYLKTQGTEADGSSALDIGFASRAFKDTEAAAADTTGQICLDAVVVVLNGENPIITNITAEELRQIYNGTITTWAGLQG